MDHLYYENELGKLYNGDSLELIKELETKSIQAIITSPPYWGLRDYGHGKQLGLEEDYNEYLNKLFSLFDEGKRVLKDDGILFVNIADTYSGTCKKGDYVDPKNPKGRKAQSKSSINQKVKGIKRKSLTGIPQRFMIKMIDSGWILRNTIIWHKPNAMPHSIKDRFTVDFEYIYMFTKKPIYKFNQLKEKMKTFDRTPPRGSKGSFTPNNGLRKQDTVNKTFYTGLNDRYEMPKDLMRNKRAVWSINTQPIKEAHFATFPLELVENMILCSTDKNDIILDPFMGSGTTAYAAQDNNRSWIGFELNSDYCKLIKNRVKTIHYRLEI